MSSLETAKALHRSGEIDKAQVLYYQILETDPQHMEAIYLLSTVLFSQKAYKAALDLLNRGLTCEPKSSNLLMLKGDILRDNSLWKEALAQYIELVRNECISADLLLSISYCYVELNDYETAKQYVNHIWTIGEMKLQTAKKMCEIYILMSDWQSLFKTIDALWMGGMNDEQWKGFQEIIVNSLKRLSSSLDILDSFSGFEFSSYKSYSFLIDLFSANKRMDLALKFCARSKKKQEIISERTYLQEIQCYRSLEEYSRCIEVIDLALLDHDRSMELHYQKASSLRALGQYELAVESFLKCLEFDRENFAVWQGLGLAYSKINTKEIECIQAYLKAYEIEPNNVSLLIKLGTELVNVEQLELGRMYFRLARKLEPENEFVLQLLAHINVNMKPNEFKDATEEAILCCKELRRICPDEVHTLNNCATLYQNLLRVNDSIPFSRQSLDTKVSQETIWCVYLFHLFYESTLTPKYIADEHKRWAAIFESKTSVEKLNISSFDPKKRLRIGFVSSDMYYHPVAYFLISVLKEFDSDQTESFIYSGRKVEDTFSAKVKAEVDHWRRVRDLSDESFSKLIQEDGIDILIDLSGHTTGNRMGVFFKKPAPIQVAWMGYPGTTGMSRMDYRISDSITEPTGDADQISSEKIVRIENGFHAYVPFYEYPEVANLPALDRGYISFGSFNNIRKLSPGVISLWAKILQRVPNSRLILKDRHFDAERNRQWILSMFAANGISELRINLLGMMSNNVAHMRAYSLMDIALDSFPYNGTTTTCEALVNGVPVVSLLGNSHVSRVTSSLLTHSGYSQWVAKNEEEYINIACDLASDPSQLVSIRKELRTKFLSSPVGDPKRLASSLENEFRKMWKKYCNENSISADN